jgi:competence protein ComEC
VAGFAPAVPLGGIVANLVAVPLGELAALPLCLLHALLGVVGGAPELQSGAALIASGALEIVRAVARVFAAPWLAVEVPPPTSWQLVALAIGAAGALLKRGVARRVTVAFVVVALLVLEHRARDAGAPRGVLRATFFDVGQGDAAIVDLPDGQALVIDGGGLVGSPVDTGARVLAPALRARRRGDVVAVVLSHPHPDHFTGLATGLVGVRVHELWDTGQGEREHLGGAYSKLLGDLRRKGASVRRPSELCGAPRDFGGARVEVLAPCPGPLDGRGANDNSFVVRISYGARAFLFVGDAEREEEKELVASAGARLRADVLKVGHHGSKTSSTPPFLAQVAPAAAVISCGVRNRFDHPSARALDALARAGARVWRTDEDGAVVAETDGVSVQMHAMAR